MDGVAQRLNAQQIANLWVREGGAPKYANLMARIALRESGGNPYATNHNTNGSIDRGLFQINSVWGGLSNRALGDPVAATRAAIHILKVQGPKAWATYNPATDHKYLGGFTGNAGPSTASPGTTPSPIQQGDSGLASLIAQLQDRPSRPQGSIIQAPQYTSGRYFTPVQPGMAKQDTQGSSLSDLLASMDQQGLTTPAVQGQSGGSGGVNAPPAAATGQFKAIFERAASINSKHLPYQWGGGHGPTPAKPGVPLDCSGAVSEVLGVTPRVAAQYKSFGQAGQGRQVTIWAARDGHHVLMEINGHFWGTSATNPGGGAGWIPRAAISSNYLKGFVARHPAGL